ncbi:MAG: hypothetical protein JNL38_03580 [Myxococcales bacterium]|jgi:hypothetical protein|nr:hypothetical protein [Myxococcales bacterium]
MRRASTFGFAFACVLAVVAACTSDPAGSSSGSSADGGSSSGSSGDAAGGDSAAPDAGGNDAGRDADAAGTCDGACKTTSLTVTIGAKSGPLDRAQFGFNTTDGAVPTVQVEAHFGGDPACPSQTSPTPDRTVVFANVPLAKGVATEANGLKATLLDFKGDLTTEPIVRATAVKLTVVDFVSAPKASSYVAFDVEATFPGGSVKGHAYATHCDSMDD